MYDDFLRSELPIYGGENKYCIIQFKRYLIKIGEQGGKKSIKKTTGL